MQSTRKAKVETRAEQLINFKKLKAEFVFTDEAFQI